MSMLARALSSAAAPPAKLYDAVIVGGGIVGAALAAKLALHPATAGRRVAMLETAAPKPVSAHLALEAPDLRVYSLSAATVRLLDEVGVWGAIEPRARPAFTDMQVWDECGSGFVRFDAASCGAAELGHVVEHGILQAALFERLGELDNVRVVCPSTVTDLSVPRVSEDTGFVPFASVSTADETLETRLVVAADGANSTVRARWHVPTWGWGYPQRALVATVATAELHSTAWQRFLPTGPVALLPVRDGLSSVVWSGTPEMVADLQAMSPEAFVAALNDAYQRPTRRVSLADWLPAVPGFTEAVRAAEGVGSALMLAGGQGGFALPPSATACVGRRFAFDLKLAHASSYVGNRMALIGDAAHTVHPLAGQGLNLGMGDVEALGSALVGAAESGADFGDRVVLRGYETDRKAANLLMQGACDGFQKLFSTSSAPVAAARNAGMAAVNLVPAAKAQLAKAAMGL